MTLGEPVKRDILHPTLLKHKHRYNNAYDHTGTYITTATENVKFENIEYGEMDNTKKRYLALKS